MGQILRIVLLVLGWALLGAIGALLLGMVGLWLVQSMRWPEGSQMMGYAIAVMFFLTPLGGLLGGLAAGVALWRARRRMRQSVARSGGDTSGSAAP